MTATSDVPILDHNFCGRAISRPRRFLRAVAGPEDVHNESRGRCIHSGFYPKPFTYTFFLRLLVVSMLLLAYAASVRELTEWIEPGRPGGR